MPKIYEIISLRSGISITFQFYALRTISLQFFWLLC